MNMIEDKKWFLREIKKLSEKQIEKEIEKWLNENFKKFE